jgi:UMP-CMP kinase
MHMHPDVVVPFIVAL